MPRLGAMLREMQRKLAASYDEEEDDDEDGEGDDGGGGDGDDGDGDGDGIDDEGGAAAAAAAAAAGGELGVEAAEASAAALPRSAWRAAARAPPALEKRELAAQVGATFVYTTVSIPRRHACDLIFLVTKVELYIPSPVEARV